MNARIKELLEQASEYAHENRAGDWEVGPAYQDIFNEKFAELIVREGYQVVTSIPTISTSLAGRNMLDHFGFEE